MDVGALLVAARDFPIPVDEILLELRRVSDNVVVFNRTLTSAEWSTSTTEVRIEITLDLENSPEDFVFTAIVRGGGVEYYRATGTVTATAGGTTTTPPIAPVYTGPGTQADQLIFAPPGPLGNGQQATLTATVMQGNVTLTGVPVSYTSSNPALIAPVALGLDQATITTPVAGSGSVTITAETPNGLSASGTVSWAPTAVAIVMVSGDGQNVPAGTQAALPLVVEVRDAAQNPVSGFTVDFVVTAGPSGTSVNPASMVTDGQGRAQTTLTAGNAAGPITVEARATGLAGSPIIFTATATAAPGPPASVSANSPLTQNATVNTAVSSPPSVMVLDASSVPVPGATVTFAVQTGNGTITGATQTTDANGVATVGSWTLPQTTGDYTLTATVGTLPSVSFTATATADAPAGVTAIAGDAQTGPAGAPLASFLVVEVRDQFNNLVPSATVNWATPDGGSFAPASGPTGVNGQAQTTWTLGPTAPSQTATATVGALAPATFTATATFGPSPITLAFVGVPDVGVGLSATVRASIPTPAPAGGVAVTLASDLPGTVAVAAPATRTIAQGQTTVDFTVNGVAVGATTLRANATGYTEGTLPITVQNRNISVPVTLNVPYGGTASLPIQLPDPAPAGGVTFTVVSSAPGNVSVANSPVTIGAGGQTANATLNGVLPGPATITVSNPAYIDGITAATTTASLNIVQTSATLNQSFGTSITINFESSGVPTAAPSPGISVTLTPTDPTCVAATTPVTIATGTVSTTSTLTYGGSANLPCTTRVKAEATNLLADSINATVNLAPGISVGTLKLGGDLQDASSFTLGASNHGGVTVTVSSSTPEVLLAPNTTTAGQQSIQFNLLNGQTFQTFYAQALSRVTDTVVATITVSATGFTDGTGSVQAIPPALDLQGLPGATTTLSPSNPIYARVGTPNASNTALDQVQSVRAGGTPLTVTFTTPNNGFGDLLKAATAPGLTQDATIPADGSRYYSPTDTVTGGVAFHPLTAGTTTVSATIPNYLVLPTATRSVTVSQPGISVGSLKIGSGLQDATSFSLGASNHGGVTVRLTSSSPDVLLAPTATTAGNQQITFDLLNGETFRTFYVQAVEGRVTDTVTATVTAVATGFSDGTGTMTAIPPALDLIGLPTSTTTLSPSSAIYARVGTPNAQNTALDQVQSVRFGGTQLTVTFTTPNNGFGDLLKAATAPGLTQDATIPADGTRYYTPTDTTSGGVAFHPLTAGTTTVTATIPNYVVIPTATRSVTISQSGISVGSLKLGSGLQDATSFSLGASNHGGVTVTVSSSSPEVLLAPTATTAGLQSIQFNLANGETFRSFYAQALEGRVTDTVLATITVSATGFSDGTNTIQAIPPALDLIGLPASTTTLSPSNPIYARVGTPNAQNTALDQVQSVRFGGTPRLVTFATTPLGLGELLKAATPPAPTQTATIPADGTRYYTPTDTTSGGVAFDPLLGGTASVSATIQDFIALPTATRSINISQPGITVGALRVASGLQDATSFSLGAANHGGVTVTLTSSNPAMMLSPDATTAGQSQISFNLNDGETFRSFYVQGNEGITQATVTTVTVSASGFTDGTNTMTIEPIAMDLLGLPTSTTTLSAANAIYVRVGTANAQSTALDQVQSIRAGGNPLTATFTLVPANGVGELLKAATPAATTQTATIPAGGTRYYTPTDTTSGGVAFHPLVIGSTSVVASIPGVIATSQATRPVTVSQPGISMGTLIVGSGLQDATIFTLGAPEHGGVTVTLNSSSSQILLAPDAATPGQQQISFNMADGQTSRNFYVQGLEGVTQTVAGTVTATATGFANGNGNMTVVQGAVDLIGVPTTLATTAPTANIYARVGTPNVGNTSLTQVQSLRAGGPGALTATFTTNNVNAASLVTSTQTGGAPSETAQIVTGLYYTPTSVATGGVGLRPVAPGNATITASVPGFITTNPAGIRAVQVQ
jgi:adhesin/invasin